MGTVYKRRNTWTMDYKDQHGNNIQKAIGNVGVITKTMAKDILRKKEQQVILGEHDLLDAKIPTINNISKEYLHHQKVVKQIRSYSRSVQAISHFSNLFGTTKLNEISASDIDVFKQRRLEKGKVQGF